MARTLGSIIILSLSLLFPLINLFFPSFPKSRMWEMLGYNPELSRIYIYIFLLWILTAIFLIIAKKYQLKMKMIKHHRHKFTFFAVMTGICFGIIFYGEIIAKPSLAIFVLMIAASLVEEYYFRGMLLSHFKKYGNIIQASLFAIMHLRYSYLLIGYFIFGLFMGHLRKHGLFYPMLAHSITNAVEFSLLYVTFL
ncbi:MAG: CPBP family intramembrane glutamic endopeptidase [Candidatus Woesearchaeota archaeon]